jgi:hypothetical protein
MVMKWTRSNIEAHKAVHSITIKEGRVHRGDCYRVLIYLNDGWRGEDRTSTLYGSTLQEAGNNLAFIEKGDPE